MNYSIGVKGSMGCMGYPVINENDEIVADCPTRIEAENYIEEMCTTKADDNALLTYPGVGIKYPSQGMASANGAATGSSLRSKYGKKPKVNRSGRSGNANDNANGSFVSGGPGGSMGNKFDDVNIWNGSAFEKRDYSTHARERMASTGEAMPDGSFPIANGKDLQNAIQSIGRASDPAKAKAHIKARARALGMEDMLPEGW
jgi:hypothetical protein